MSNNDGPGWSPDGGKFWMKDGKCYWETGHITNGLPLRMMPLGHEHDEDYSAWTPYQRSVALKKFNDKALEARAKEYKRRHQVCAEAHAILADLEADKLETLFTYFTEYYE